MTSKQGSLHQRLAGPEETLPSSSSVVPIQSGTSRPPLFVLAPGAMTVMGTARVARSLDREQPFYALQPPGMGGPAPDFPIEDTATAYVKDIQQERPSGPYFLGGMCMGGALALEMAQQLVAKGEKVELLVIVDTWLTNPRRYEPGFRNFASVLTKLLSPRQLIRRNIRRQKGRFKRWRWSTIFGRTARGRDIVRIKEMNMKARSNYTAQVYPGKILLFLSEQFAKDFDMASEWSLLAAEGLEHHVIPGSSHRSMWKPPHIDMWSEILNEALAKAQA